MPITYDLDATGDDLIVSEVRLEIGDTVADDGVKPYARNFTDAELLHLYNDEGGDSIGKATARVCEILSRMWARLADMRVGPQSEKLSDISVAWSKRAGELRSAHGGGAGSMTSDDIMLDFATRGEEEES